MVGIVMGQRSRDEWVIASDLQDWPASLVDGDSSWRHWKWLNWHQLLQIGQEKKLSGKWTLSLGPPTGRTGERVHCISKFENNVWNRSGVPKIIYWIKGWISVADFPFFWLGHLLQGIPLLPQDRTVPLGRYILGICTICLGPIERVYQMDPRSILVFTLHVSCFSASHADGYRQVIYSRNVLTIIEQLL